MCFGIVFTENKVVNYWTGCQWVNFSEKEVVMGEGWLALEKN